MGADLHIHVFEGVDEKDLAEFFSNTLGSKYFNPRTESRSNALFGRISATPNIWVGEVSWLKAALFGDGETYVPAPIKKVNEIVGEELPAIDDVLIESVRQAMSLPNATLYSLAGPDEIVSFLEQHRGKRVFTVSW